MKEYGNMLTLQTSAEELTVAEEKLANRAVIHNFLSAAIEYDFPVEAEPEAISRPSEKVLIPTVVETGEPYTGSTTFRVPEGVELVWTGNYYHYRGWYYQKQDDPVS